MDTTKSESAQFGSEVRVESVSGRKKLGDDAPIIETLDSVGPLSLKGQYMAIQLSRLFLNLTLKSSYNGSIRRFTMAEMVFHNVWDHPMSVYMSLFKMVDSEGFQHPGDLCEFREYSKAFHNGQAIDVSFPWPEQTLEDNAKTKGWIWFEELQHGALPQRLIFPFQIFEPGHTSGWVRNTETLEFFIKGCSTAPLNAPPKN